MATLMNKQLTKKNYAGKWCIARPSTYKTEYHGNGINAWYGQEEIVNGHKIEYKSKRYSYRWHKMQVFFDGRQLMTAGDYRKAEAQLNS